VAGVLSEFGFRLEPTGTDADLEDLGTSYIAGGGWFAVLEDSHGDPVGCVGLYPLPSSGRGRRVCELRKMYLRREARGHGHGRRLLEEAISRARELGFQTVVLETASTLTDAIALYTRFGFQPYEPSHCSPRCDRSFQLELSGRSS
jgi:putative acetyltransferase